jgi:hypothetical protein
VSEVVVAPLVGTDVDSGVGVTGACAPAW